MNFVLELLLNIVGQIIFDLIGEALIEGGAHGAARVLRSRTGRVVVGAGLGTGFGLFWGDHLDGGQHWPKLLWVSLAMALIAAARLASAPPPPAGTDLLRESVVPPWQWPASRLLTFIAINLGIAAGIALTFHAASPALA